MSFKDAVKLMGEIDSEDLKNYEEILRKVIKENKEK